MSSVDSQTSLIVLVSARMHTQLSWDSLGWGVVTEQRAGSADEDAVRRDFGHEPFRRLAIMKHNALSRFDPERSPLVTRDLITRAHLFGWEVIGDDDFSFSVRDAQGLTLTLKQVWRVGLVLEQDATGPQHEPQSVAITESLWWAENLLAALIASKRAAGDAEQSTAAFPGVEATIPEHSLLRQLDPTELTASALEQWLAVPTNPVQTGDDR